MKKLILPFTLVLLGLTGAAGTASAQRYEERAVEEHYEGPSISIRSGRDNRVGGEIEQLNREVRMLRDQIRDAGGAGRRVRGRFDSVMRSTDRVTALYRQGSGRPWELRRRAEQIRAEIAQIRRDLRFRDIRREIGR